MACSRRLALTPPGGIARRVSRHEMPMCDACQTPTISDRDGVPSPRSLLSQAHAFSPSDPHIEPCSSSRDSETLRLCGNTHSLRRSLNRLDLSTTMRKPKIVGDSSPAWILHSDLPHASWGCGPTGCWSSVPTSPPTTASRLGCLASAASPFPPPRP